MITQMNTPATLHRVVRQREAGLAEARMAFRRQATFRPERASQTPALRVGILNVPCQSVGGDCYDVIDLPDGRVGLIIADASGHGFAAARIMAEAHALFRVQAAGQTPPHEVIRRVNALLAHDLAPDTFVTAFYGILDPQSYRLTYTNAGHPFPMILHAQAGQIEDLRKGGIPLGLFPQGSYEQGETRLDPGDTLLLYTDGVTEASNADEEEFSEGRLRALLIAHHQADPQHLVETIYTNVSAFMTFPPRDDVAMVVVQRSRATDARGIEAAG